MRDFPNPTIWTSLKCCQSCLFDAKLAIFVTCLARKNRRGELAILWLFLKMCKFFNFQGGVLVFCWNFVIFFAKPKFHLDFYKKFWSKCWLFLVRLGLKGAISEKFSLATLHSGKWVGTDDSYILTFFYPKYYRLKEMGA